mmetsp:Transcript_40236/g.65213  ORF Transcript_40236/g.65213 Transcript_40236/m.65213 type:complete len:174 (+) Transcript_40236:2485-3006(+)
MEVESGILLLRKKTQRRALWVPNGSGDNSQDGPFDEERDSNIVPVEAPLSRRQNGGVEHLQEDSFDLRERFSFSREGDGRFGEMDRNSGLSPGGRSLRSPGKEEGRLRVSSLSPIRRSVHASDDDAGQVVSPSIEIRRVRSAINRMPSLSASGTRADWAERINRLRESLGLYN